MLREIGLLEHAAELEDLQLHADHGRRAVFELVLDLPEDVGIVAGRDQRGAQGGGFAVAQVGRLGGQGRHTGDEQGKGGSDGAIHGTAFHVGSVWVSVARNHCRQPHGRGDDDVKTENVAASPLPSSGARVVSTASASAAKTKGGLMTVRPVPTKRSSAE